MDISISEDEEPTTKRPKSDNTLNSSAPEAHDSEVSNTQVTAANSGFKVHSRALRDQRKLLRNTGKEYTTIRGKINPGRKT